MEEFPGAHDEEVQIKPEKERCKIEEKASLDCEQSSMDRKVFRNLYL